MLELLQLLLDGLLDGGVYALLGLGLSLTFGCLKRLNLAYGATAMLAAYIGVWCHFRYEASIAVVAFIVVVAATFIGWYVEQLCFSRSDDPGFQSAVGAQDRLFMTDSGEMVALASSFAIWMQLEQLAVNLLPRHLNPFPSMPIESSWMIGGIAIRQDRLLLTLLAAVISTGISLWLLHTRAGLSWRAASDHRTAAHLVGIPVVRLQTIGFILASAMSGIASFAVLSLDGQVTPMFGMWVLFKGLVAAMLGGLGSILGVLWGGLLLGVVESFSQSLLGAQGREFATYALLLLVLILPRHSDSGRRASWGIRI